MGENVGDEHLSRGADRRERDEGRVVRGHRKISEMLFVRVSDDLGDAGKSCDFLWRALGVAAGDHNLTARVCTANAANGSAGVLVGRGCDRAGVQNDDLRVRGRRGAFESAVGKLPLDCRAVGLSGAAAKILDVKAGHGSMLNETGLNETGLNEL